MSYVSISGNVNADGTLQSGAGFNISKEGTGLYLISFLRPFLSEPAVVATPNYPGWNDFDSDGGETTVSCVVVALDRNRVKIKTSEGGTAADGNFSFIASGT